MSQHRRPTHHRRRTGLAVAAVAVAALTLVGSSSPALAARGGGNPADGVPHWGQQVRFDVSTTATAQPHVSLSCSQAGSVVYTAETGYYDSYPWPWTQTFTLASGAWTSGAADCVGTMYYFSGRKTVTGATLGFHVYA